MRGACFRVVAARPASVGVEAGTTWAAYDDGGGELFVRRPYDEVSIEGRAWTEDGHLLVAREPLPGSRTPELVAEGVTELVAVLASGTYATRRTVHPWGGPAVGTTGDVSALAERAETIAWIERSSATLELVEHDPVGEVEVGRHALADSASAPTLVARQAGFDVILDQTLWRLRDGALEARSLDAPVDEAFAHQDSLFTRVGDELRNHDDDGAITARATVPGLIGVFWGDYNWIWVETGEGVSALEHDLTPRGTPRLTPAPELRASIGALLEYVPQVDVAWGEGGFARLTSYDPDAPGPRFAAMPVVEVAPTFRQERVVALRAGDAVRIERVVTEGYCD